MTGARLTEEELAELDGRRNVAWRAGTPCATIGVERLDQLLATARRCAELEARVAELTNALKPFAVGCLLDDSGVSTGKPNPNCCCHCFARHALREPPKESDDE